MNETQDIKFKPAIFSKKHLIILHPEFIEFYKTPEGIEPVKFSKFEIDAFRFGIRWLSGYKLILAGFIA